MFLLTKKKRKRIIIPMGTTVGVLFVVEIKPIHPLDSTTEFSPKKSRHACVGRDKRWAHQVTSKVLTKGMGRLFSAMASLIISFIHF